MERETLSNNTKYQERLREAKIKGVIGARTRTMMKELVMVSDYESRPLQQQVRVTIGQIQSIVSCACAKSEPSLYSYRRVSKQ